MIDVLRGLIKFRNFYKKFSEKSSKVLLIQQSRQNHTCGLNVNFGTSMTNTHFFLRAMKKNKTGITKNQEFIDNFIFFSLGPYINNYFEYV